MGRKLSISKKSFTFAAVYIQIGNDNIETKNDKKIKRRVKARPKSTTYTGYFVELDLSKTYNELDNISLIKFFIKNEKTIN